MSNQQMGGEDVVDEWRLYWTPEEYADMQGQMAPEQLAEEMGTRRAKRARLLAAREMGFGDTEAVLMGVKAMMITHEPEVAGRGDRAEGSYDDNPPF